MASITFDDRGNAAKNYAGLLRELGHIVTIGRHEIDVEVSGLSIGIEYKCPADFVASIFDRRVFRQADELVLYYAYPMVVVDGDLGSCSGIAPNVFWGAVSSLMFHHQCPVQFTFGHFHIFLDRAIRKIVEYGGKK